VKKELEKGPKPSFAEEGKKEDALKPQSGKM
jgi:hypothetical protein